MSKFVIECPDCGNYVEVSNFFHRKATCSCGREINVSTDKMTSRKCPHCGNVVVFDQSKGEKAQCPVCHEKINTLELTKDMVKFHCPSCSCELSADVTAESFICPLCDTVIDVQKQAAKDTEKNKGLASAIKYEGDNKTFIWKHPIEDFNLGSQLIVHESQEAIFFRDGKALDLFGAGRYTLSTQNLPLLENLYKLPTNTDTPFHSEVYFINKTVQMGIKWGTPDKVRFIDPLTGTPLEIGASGEMNLTVSDSRKLLLKLVGTTTGISWDETGSGFTKSLQNSFRPLITSAIKTNLSAAIKNNNIDLLEVDEKLDLLSQTLKEKINEGFEEYGLTIPQFFVTNILLPEDDPNFKRIRDLHTVTLQAKMLQAEANVKVVEAQTQTIYRTEQEKSKAAIEAQRREAELQRQLTETEVKKREAERTVIEAQAAAQAERLKGLTEAEIMRAKGYNQKDVLQADVQKAYAEGIGNMSFEGGSGGIAGDVMGLGVGLAAASKIAPQIGNMFNGMNSNQSNDLNNTPSQDLWQCSCGNMASGKFCNVCGKQRPEENAGNSWICPKCKNNVVGMFCSNCGTKKPVEDTWDCECGNKNIEGNFCPNCGKKREEGEDKK